MKKLSLVIIFAAIFTAIFILDSCSTQSPGGGNINSAYLNAVKEGGTYVNVTGIGIRFSGKTNEINLGDFTDMVLTKDGVPVDNKLIYNGAFDQGDGITDIYFDFENENRESGIYAFTAKYKGVDFKTRTKIAIEDTPPGDTPANPDDLSFVNYAGIADGEKYIELTIILFNFHGNQQAFYISDLTDLKLTCEDQKIEFKLADNVIRNLEVGRNDELNTQFDVYLEEALSISGTYQLTGIYRGNSFTARIN